MKLVKYMRNWGLSILATSCLLSSCDYLDVVPPEQPNLPDATSTYQRALGFLYSCYNGIYAVDPNASNYLHEFFSSTDEWTLPYPWMSDGIWDDYANNTVTANNNNWLWGTTYQYIGQCLLFLQELDKMDPTLVPEDELKQWRAEANFLIAYYHFITLRSYGPIPITDSYISMDAPASSYNGRFHFDYCVDWIADRMDAAAEDLPAYREKSDQWGRVTKVVAKALKARMLLYAASPLWNGNFPYPSWKNANFETPGYGKELVSKTYEPEKWDRALLACKEALELAEGAGRHELYDDDAFYKTENLDLPYVPGLSDIQYNPSIEEEATLIAERTKFLETVLKMRYLVTTRADQGNREIIWGNWNFDRNKLYAYLPHRILTYNQGLWWNGWSGVSPTLNAVQYFYSKNGLPITEDDEYYAESEWYKASPYTRTITNDNNETNVIQVANLHIDREPRFYAWIGFDGGDFTSRVRDGKPLTLELHNVNMHGYSWEAYNRDNSATGYLCQKYLYPKIEFNRSGSGSWGSDYPGIMIRLAELYLNLAECYAAKGDVDNTLKYLNPIRERAGIPALTETDITDKMTLTEWVRRERFVELYGEGHRFFDVRRWVEGAKYFGAGVRKGLNAGVVNPSWEEFYKPTALPHSYVWTNRMYLNPVFYNEVYKNPQMVQAPEY